MMGCLSPHLKMTTVTMLAGKQCSGAGLCPALPTATTAAAAGVLQVLAEEVWPAAAGLCGC
jgi:hypothetical protein